jgi:hypothetical protein
MKEAVCLYPNRKIVMDYPYMVYDVGGEANVGQLIRA